MKCPIAVFFAQHNVSLESPAGSQVGVFSLVGSAGVYQGAPGFIGERNPIFDLKPEDGFAAEFGLFNQASVKRMVIQAGLAHTGKGYVVRAIAPSLVKAVFGPYYLQTTFFNNPKKLAGLPGAGEAFFTNPSDCDGEPLRTTIHSDAWSNPAPVPQDAKGAPDFAAADLSAPQWHTAVAESPAVGGCEALQFQPTISLKPDTSAGGSTSGLDVSLGVPQNEDPNGLGTPPLRDAVVKLPAGLVVNPSSAAGQQGSAPPRSPPKRPSPATAPIPRRSAKSN